MEIEARLIIEIMGRPKEHIVTAMQQLIDKIGKESGVKITDSKIREPVEVKDSKNLFTTFSEIEAKFSDIVTCFRVVFTYLPSNIEILNPESMKMKNEELTTLLNALSARLHDYDAIAKRLVAERDILVNQIKSKKESKEA